MLNRIRPRLNHGTIVAYLALFVALCGTSYSAVKISGKNITNKSISGKKLKNRTITRGKVKRKTLTGTEIRDRSLLARDFKLGQLPAGPQGPPGPGASWAIIDKNGAVLGQSGGVAATHIGNGTYRVTFPISLARKVVLVSNAAVDGDTIGRGATQVAVCASGHGASSTCSIDVFGVTGDRSALVTTLGPGELMNQPHAFSIAAF